MDKKDRKEVNKTVAASKNLGLKSDAAFQIKSATSPDKAIEAFDAATDEEKKILVKLLIVKKHKAKSDDSKNKYDARIVGYKTNGK